MLKNHMDAVENQLLSISKVPAGAGHALHKGTPREAFIRGFLADHLSERVGIGSGEIIDCHSKPGEARNQMDIVIYKRDYPKLDFGGGVNAFLVESVVATIEVKSVLDKAGVRQSICASERVKGLTRSMVLSFRAGYQPPGILSFVVAYDGPASMGTVHGWLSDIHREEGVSYPPMGTTSKERLKVASSSLDAVFVLGKGFVHFDNLPVSFVTDEERSRHPDVRWFFSDTATGNLLLLFVNLTYAVSGVSGSWLDPMPYLSSFSVPNLTGGG